MNFDFYLGEGGGGGVTTPVHVRLVFFRLVLGSHSANISRAKMQLTVRKQ